MDCMAAVLGSTTCKVGSDKAIPWPITALTYVGYGTTTAVLGLPVINTFFKVWEMKAVGVLRGEPLVASLLGYVCSFLFNCMENNWVFNDSVWISLIGITFYSIYLGLFFKYAHDADRRVITVKWILLSVSYILFIMVPGIVADSTAAVQWMYMLAGLVSACTPLVLIWFVLEKNIENLPDWLSSAVGVLHYVVWVILALFPEWNYFDIAQNVAGAVCSVILLALLFRRRNEAELVAGHGVGVYAPLIPNQHIILDVGAESDTNDEAQAVDDPLPEPHPFGTNDEAQAVDDPLPEPHPFGTNDEAQAVDDPLPEPHPQLRERRRASTGATSPKAAGALRRLSH